MFNFVSEGDQKRVIIRYDERAFRLLLRLIYSSTVS